MAKAQRICYSTQNPPTSIQEAETAIQELSAEVMQIFSDLSDKSGTNHRTGEAWDSREYHFWSRSALYAKACMVRQIRFLRRWVIMESKRYAAKTIRVDFDDPKSLVHAAHSLIANLQNRGAKLQDEEKALQTLLHDFLLHH